ncbi:MAG: hypothetical protein ACFFDC_17430 [Promethearchaeota archaeon]
MVNSIAKIVQTIIDDDLPLQDALRKDYGNYSAIARMIMPKISDTIGRKVKLESVITAVKRAKVSYQPQRGDVNKVLANSIINLRTDVAKISVEKTRNNLKKVRETVSNFSHDFLNVVEGISAITLIFDENLYSEIYSQFNTRDVLDKRQKLAAVILRSPKDLVTTPGCLLNFVSAISRKGINIEETLSCFTDTIFILNMNDVSKGFAALTDLVAETRKQGDQRKS